jgi:hypothetical protein
MIAVAGGLLYFLRPISHHYGIFGDSGTSIPRTPKPLWAKVLFLGSIIGAFFYSFVLPFVQKNWPLWHQKMTNLLLRRMPKEKLKF